MVFERICIKLAVGTSDSSEASPSHHASATSTSAHIPYSREYTLWEFSCALYYFYRFSADGFINKRRLSFQSVFGHLLGKHTKERSPPSLPLDEAPLLSDVKCLQAAFSGPPAHIHNSQALGALWHSHASFGIKTKNNRCHPLVLVLLGRPGLDVN